MLINGSCTQGSWHTCLHAECNRHWDEKYFAGFSDHPQTTPTTVHITAAEENDEVSPEITQGAKVHEKPSLRVKKVTWTTSEDEEDQKDEQGRLRNNKLRLWKKKQQRRQNAYLPPEAQFPF